MKGRGMEEGSMQTQKKTKTGQLPAHNPKLAAHQTANRRAPQQQSKATRTHAHTPTHTHATHKQQLPDLRVLLCVLPFLCFVFFFFFSCFFGECVCQSFFEGKERKKESKKESKKERKKDSLRVRFFVFLLVLGRGEKANMTRTLQSKIVDTATNFLAAEDSTLVSGCGFLRTGLFVMSVTVKNPDMRSLCAFPCV